MKFVLPLLLAIVACDSTKVDERHDGGSDAGTLNAQTGGQVSQLLFAVVGDTRPANIDDPAGYPTAIAQGIYGALAKLTPAPQFVIATGDYMYSSTGSGATAAQQMQLYIQAQNLFPSVPHWPVMGNHECDGYTADMCPNYNETPNIQAFMTSMMQPIGESVPYYVRNVNATDGSWTSKFIFLAPNAWTTTQQTWLTTQLAIPTTYTFIVKHEAEDTTGITSIPTIAGIVNAAPTPVTLGIVGHVHSWEWKGNEVIIGNGGAPVSGGVPYGYTLFQQQSNGNIVITAYDYTNGQSFQTQTITATGASVN